MDMFRVLSAVLLFTGLFIVGCQGDDNCTQGSGTVVTNEIDAMPFQTISNASLADINLQSGNEVSVSLTAEDNIIDDIIVGFTDASMTVDTQLDCVSTNQEATVEAVTTSIIRLINSGNGDITGEAVLIDTEIVNSSNGDINLEGNTAESVSITNTGNGDVSLAHNITGRALVGNLGNGDIYVVVSGILEGAISGNGDIYYSGSPTSIDVIMSGNGELIDNN